MVKQEPTLEAMPANYNPNEVEEEEYKPMPANKRKRASKDNGTSVVSAPKKPKKVQELAKETISERKTTEGEREGSRIEVMPTAEILTGSHVCVLGCGEEVDDIDMKHHYADHYLQEAVRASLFVHPVLGCLLPEDLKALEETYKTSIIDSKVKQYQCSSFWIRPLEATQCVDSKSHTRKMCFREFFIHKLNVHHQLEVLLKRDTRPGMEGILERLYPSPQVKAREEARRKEKEAMKVLKVKQEVKEKQEMKTNAREVHEKASEPASKSSKVQTKDPVKVKKEAVESVGFELEEASNEEDVDNPSNEQVETVGDSSDNLPPALQDPPTKAPPARRSTTAPESPPVPAKEVPGRVEVVRKDTTARVEEMVSKEKLSRVEVVRKDPQVRLPEEVVRRVAVDRVHSCVLCNDKDGRSMNLGSGLWDIKYHYAVRATRMLWKHAIFISSLLSIGLHMIIIIIHQCHRSLTSIIIATVISTIINYLHSNGGLIRNMSIHPTRCVTTT